MQILENILPLNNYDDLVRCWKYLKEEDLINRIDKIQLDTCDIERSINVFPLELEHSNFTIENTSYNFIKSSIGINAVVIIISIVDEEIAYYLYTKIILRRTIYETRGKIKPLPYSIINEIFYYTDNTTPLKQIIAYVKDNDDIDKYSISVSVVSDRLDLLNSAIVAIPYEIEAYFDISTCASSQVEKALRDCVWKYKHNCNIEKLMKVAKFINSIKTEDEGILSILSDINDIVLAPKPV